MELIGGWFPSAKVKALPACPAKTIEVLVVAIHKEVVNQYNEIAKISELHTEFWDWNF